MLWILRQMKNKIMMCGTFYRNKKLLTSKKSRIFWVRKKLKEHNLRTLQ